MLKNIFLPISKIDEENRLVYGRATFEGVDSSNEIWDYEGSKPYFEAWTENAQKTSGGKSLGNLRSMHQPIAAGKLTQFVLDDATKSCEIVARVVDDGEWNKVLEGVYTGFSQGGRYVKRWKDPDDSTKTRFISDPIEISLVDLPCLPGATFEYVKADGTTEVRKLTKETDVEPTNEQIAARAAEMAKAQGGAWTDYLEAASAALKAEAAPPETVETPVEPVETTEKVADPAPEPVVPETLTDEQVAELEASREAAAKTLRQVWLAPDGTTHRHKHDAIKHLVAHPPASPVAAALEAARKAATGEVTVPMVGVETIAEVHAEVTKWHSALVSARAQLGERCVEKGLYTVSRLADLLQDLSYITSSTCWERQSEGDDSKVPEQLATNLRDLGQTLVAMAQEEVAELVAELTQSGIAVEELLVSDDAEIVALAATVQMVKADEALMTKAGARNSKKDAETIQKMHDQSVDLGATCGSADKAAGEVDLAKRAESDPVLKAVLDRAVAAENQVSEAVAGIAELGETLKTMRTEMETLKSQPAPMAPRTQAVGKGAETGASTDGELSAIIKSMMATEQGQRTLAEAAIRASQATGGHTQ